VDIEPVQAEVAEVAEVVEVAEVAEEAQEHRSGTFCCVSQWQAPFWAEEAAAAAVAAVAVEVLEHCLELVQGPGSRQLHIRTPTYNHAGLLSNWTRACHCLDHKCTEALVDIDHICTSTDNHSDLLSNWAQARHWSDHMCTEALVDIELDLEAV